MSELVLHIGSQKTGTTALQNFFVNNREKFNKYSWDYPILIAQTDDPSGFRNGNVLRRYCRDIVESASKARGTWQSFQMLKQSLSSFSSVLLSDEEFFLSPVRINKAASPDDPIKIFWDTVSQVISDLPVNQVTVVVYLRRQDEWIASWWKESVKHGGTEKSFAEFASSDMSLALNYFKIIDSLENAFNIPCKVIVRLYDRENFEGGSIFTDFCNAVGIPWDPAYTLPQNDLNASISFDVAEALRHFKRLAPFGTELRHQRLVPLAYSLTREHPDPYGMKPFSKDEADAFLESFREGNEKIANRFFCRNELFSPDIQDPVVWIPNWERIDEYRKLFDKECQRYNKWGYALWMRTEAYLRKMKKKIIK